MVIIQTEDGSIVRDPKEIYIDKDLDGKYFLFADLSDSGRVKPVKLTAAEHEYEEEKLGCILDALYDLLADPEELYCVTLRAGVLFVSMADVVEYACMNQE
uniref:Uncharacterized protein n=1 Tax=Siphoviridae sp. ctoRD1 TaxID=2825669 RepID=A0A8S5QFH6_9CAUD|nr:MAG TPA: hypothetical protein [Siphoviridae sp. ctoRD1]